MATTTSAGARGYDIFSRPGDAHLIIHAQDRLRSSVDAVCNRPLDANNSCCRSLEGQPLYRYAPQEAIVANVLDQPIADGGRYRRDVY